ncbi:DUF6714 family protein [Pseudomonas sp. BMS12]|uniref:DUF6714 family protein n=1 Tax=Pseudomonas sp. BMS12 TaxID=1796033 RepID=UPI003FA6C5D2
MSSTLTTELFKAFYSETSCAPLMSLRAGNAIDDYSTPTPFESEYDQVSDEYLESFHWGLSYLDPLSWRHYLPYFFQYAFCRIHKGSVVTDALLNSLRPPERTPPRLGSLSTEQETAIRHAIEHLAFAKDSVHAELACQVLEEWWLPNSVYRPIIE